MMSSLRNTNSMKGLLAPVAGILLSGFSLQAQMMPLMPGTPGGMRASPAKTDTNRTVELKFNAAALDMVLQYYCSELTGRTLLQAPAINASITLRSQSELTIPEAIQAVKTVLAMNNIALINQGDKFVKAVPITAATIEGLAIQRLRLPGPRQHGPHARHRHHFRQRRIGDRVEFSGRNDHPSVRTPHPEDAAVAQCGEEGTQCRSDRTGVVK